MPAGPVWRSRPQSARCARQGALHRMRCCPRVLLPPTRYQEFLVARAGGPAGARASRHSCPNNQDARFARAEKDALLGIPGAALRAGGGVGRVPVAALRSYVHPNVHPSGSKSPVFAGRHPYIEHISILEERQKNVTYVTRPIHTAPNVANAATGSLVSRGARALVSFIIRRPFGRYSHRGVFDRVNDRVRKKAQRQT